MFDSVSQHTYDNDLIYTDGNVDLATDDEEAKLQALARPENIRVPITYTGPSVQFPMTTAQLQQLIAAFRKKQVRDKNRIVIV